jgi:hypothetical protein
MSTAQKESPTGLGGTAGEQNTLHEAHIVSDEEEHRKRFATLAALAALAGHTLQKLGSGYLLSRWGHVRHFTDLDQAEPIIKRMERSRP